MSACVFTGIGWVLWFLYPRSRETRAVDLPRGNTSVLKARRARRTRRFPRSSRGGKG